MKIPCCAAGYMLEKDAILSKISIIKNCLKSIVRAKDMEEGAIDEIFLDDIISVNLQRAVQACIDIAHIIIAQKGLKLPATYKESFGILAKEKIITGSIASTMMKMVGFRNIAVHEYQAVDDTIMMSIIECHLKDFEVYYTQIYEYIND
ncbi:MAG: DUF86 domain-containing protein [Chitinivibrionales bacterium]|nr:DUF86 domain-containing protein [Chitinivibrionales bacterium]